MLIAEYAWWLRSRRAHVALPTALGIYVLLLVVTGDGTGWFPSIVAGSVQAKTALFAPIPMVATLLYVLRSPLPEQEAAGYRRVLRYDLVLLSCGGAAAVMLAAAVSVLNGADATLAAGRNTIFLTGLALTVHPFLRDGAALAPVTWLIAVFLLGFRGFGHYEPWTLIPEPASSPLALTAALALFGTGCLVHLIPRKAIT